jgi:hypothetical protein
MNEPVAWCFLPKLFATHLLAELAISRPSQFTSNGRRPKRNHDRDGPNARQPTPRAGAEDEPRSRVPKPNARARSNSRESKQSQDQGKPRSPPEEELEEPH